jgi:6-phosphogluconolactonase
MLCAAVLTPAAATERLVWFGTYTGAKMKSEGISVSRFDDDRGTLTPPVLATAAKNPSFLALHPRLPMLYAVSEFESVDGKAGGAVEAFAIHGATGALESRGAESTGGAGPCHVTVDRDGTVVLAANYGGGSVACLGLDDTGRLEPIATVGARSGFVQHAWDRAETTGIDTKRQGRPHAHSIDVVPNEPVAVVCDLGLDRVLLYRLHAGDATLEPLPVGMSATVRPGAGPRHLAIHPDGVRAWCINELDVTVNALTIGSRSGLRLSGTFPALSPDVTDRAGFSGAEIAVHPHGTFVYASIRGHDSIAMFRVVGTTSALEFLGCEPTRAATPRHFAIDPTGRFLLAAGQTSGTVTVFAIDRESGRLRFTGQSIAVPSPTCVLFARQPAASSNSR